MGLLRRTIFISLSKSISAKARQLEWKGSGNGREQKEKWPKSAPHPHPHPWGSPMKKMTYSNSVNFRTLSLRMQGNLTSMQFLFKLNEYFQVSN